jgi:subtilisin family serine protease
MSGPNRVRVAVVDSGIAAGHPHVGEVAEGVSLVPGVDDTLDRIGHGTAVAAAIREKAPGAELVPVKVFECALKTDGLTLAKAIRWAAEHECRIINLSLGTANTEHAALLESAVAFAIEQGALVVAAYESGGTRWLPGSLDSVIGVVGSAALGRERLVLKPGAAKGGLRLGASIYPRPIPGVPRERNLHGISFAVANVTGMLARFLGAGDGTSRSLRGFIVQLQSEARPPGST